MFELQFTVEFWFGAAILCAYETAKFNELSAVDAVVNQRFRFLPNLRARDFVDWVPFLVALAAFLIVTLIVYGALCGFSPTLIRGWVHLSGGDVAVEETVKSVPYPLYIVAGLMGITHHTIPGFARISNIQRDCFHYWIGVPRKVVETSNSFVDQMLANPHDRVALGKLVTKLSSSAWRNQIEEYADTLFYKAQIERLKLDDEGELADVLSGSLRELRSLVEQLVDIAAVATVRDGGGKALASLAGDLGVSMPPRSHRSAKRVVVGILLYAMGLTLVWFVIPMFHPALVWLLGVGAADFWPTELAYSGQYLLSQVVPILVALSIVIMIAPADLAQGRGDEVEKPSLMFLFERHAVALLAAMIAVLFFDYAQGLYDYGILNQTYKGSFVMFVIEMLPFFILHSAISLVVCFIVLKYLYEIAGDKQAASVPKTLLILFVCVALISAFYAKARLIYQFGNVPGVDYIVLIVILNVVGGTIAFVTARSISVQGRKRRSRTQLTPASAA